MTPAEKRERDRRYRAARKGDAYEHDAAYRVQYREANRDAFTEYQRRYREKHRAAIAARKLAYKKLRKGAAWNCPTWDPAMSEAASVDPAMSYDEIAAELGITKARVGQIVEKALSKLRVAHPELRVFLR